MLVTPERAIGESDEILRWVDERVEPQLRLFPADPAGLQEVEALCARFDEVLGPRARRLIYVHVLADPGEMLRFNNAGVPGWENRALLMGWPLARRFVERALDIRPGIEVEDEATVFAELDFVAERLGDGRPYLCGEHFTAADLTFAALSSAVTGPPQYGTPLPQPEDLQPQTADLLHRARAHPAGAFALRMFATERVPATA